MPFPLDPVNDPISRIRLLIGDTDESWPFLEDATYSYLLSKFNNNEKASAKEASIYILASLTKYARERTGQIEVYGSDYFKNYKDFLELFLKNPNAGLFNPMPYAGGISKKDMYLNDSVADNVRPKIYSGFTEGVHIYNQDCEKEDYYEGQQCVDPL